MAKRFTDSTKWNDDWFFNLNNEEKLAWIYILDTCDHAGIWKKNVKLLNFQIGSTFVEDSLKEIFSGKFIEIKDKWFIPNFIKFQYGKTFLTSKTPAVVSARELILELGLIQQDSNGLLTLIKELPNPTLTLTEGLDKGYVRVKDKDKDKDVVKDEYKSINKNEEINKITNKVSDKETLINPVDKLNKFEIIELIKTIKSKRIPETDEDYFISFIKNEDITRNNKSQILKYENIYQNTGTKITEVFNYLKQI